MWITLRRGGGKGSAELRGKSLQVILCRLALAAVVYHIWKHRNDVSHDNVLR
jgi:hypothetical protein